MSGYPAKVVVFDDRSYDCLPESRGYDGVGNAAGVIAFFQEQFEKVPPEHRETACIEITGEYESGAVNIEVCYWREHTAAEIAAAARREQQAVAAREARDLAEYQRLREKFGGAE